MFDDYAKKLEQLGKNVPEEFERVAKMGAIHCRNVAVRFSDEYKKVDTGAYKRNWETVATETSSGNYEITCYNGMEYASYIEDGYSIKKEHFVPFPDSNDKTKKENKSEPLTVKGKVLHHEKPRGNVNKKKGIQAFMKQFRKKYPGAKGFMAKPRRVTGLKIGRQAIKDLKFWVENQLNILIKHAEMKR